MRTNPSAAFRDDDLLLDMGVPRSLGDVVASVDLSDVARHPGVATARVANLLVTSPGLGGRTTVVPHPGLADAPLLAAVTGIDNATPAVAPFTIGWTSNADETVEGDALPESVLTYTPGEVRPLPTIGHTIPLTKQAVDHNGTLRADVDAFLSGGLIVKLEKALADALPAASGILVKAFDTNLATTVRTAIAKAQSAMRELGPGQVTVAMSPLDHAALDLAVGAGLAQWPAKIVSSPALPDGFAYVGRFKLAIQLFATPVRIVLGYTNTDFIQGRLTARATVDALPHIVAPASIIKTALS